MQPEYRILSMEANKNVVIHGMEDVIKRDLEKHKALLDRTKLENLAFKKARADEIKKKKHYRSLIGGGKYSDDALKESIEMIKVNITNMSNKVKLSEEKIKHHALIVETLMGQLDDQMEALKYSLKCKEEAARGIGD